MPVVMPTFCQGGQILMRLSRCSFPDYSHTVVCVFETKPTQPIMIISVSSVLSDTNKPYSFVLTAMSVFKEFFSFLLQALVLIRPCMIVAILTLFLQIKVQLAFCFDLLH